MLVLTRKEDERIEVFPTPDFPLRVLELLKSLCPGLSADNVEEIGRALNTLRHHPFFKLTATVVELDRRRNDVRLGVQADTAWDIVRPEVLLKKSRAMAG